MLRQFKFADVKIGQQFHYSQNGALWTNVTKIDANMGTWNGPDDSRDLVLAPDTIVQVDDGVKRAEKALMYVKRGTPFFLTENGTSPFVSTDENSKLLSVDSRRQGHIVRELGLSDPRFFVDPERMVWVDQSTFRDVSVGRKFKVGDLEYIRVGGESINAVKSDYSSLCSFHDNQIVEIT
jgi:hypothetical protein